MRKGPQNKNKMLPMSGEETSQRGFTAVEILIGIFILAVIVITIFGSYQVVSEQVAIVSQNRKLVEIGRNCLDRMTRDLTDLWVAQPPEYTPPEFNQPPDDYRLVGTQDSVGGQTHARLRFTSFKHLPIRPSRPHGIARIVYYVLADENDQHLLYRADHLYPFKPFETDPEDPILCTQVRSFTLTFYDKAGQSFDTWDSESDANDFATPVAIGIRLELGEEQHSQVFTTRVPLSVVRGVIDSRG